MCQYVFTPEQILLVEDKYWSCLNYCTKDNVDTNLKDNTHDHAEWPDSEYSDYDD